MLATQSYSALPIIRPLTANDVNAYRTLRRKILTIGDGRYFSDSYTREALLNEHQWKEWCTETNEHCIIGTFIDSELVGVMMITKHGTHEDHMVEWEAIWLEPSYRRQGIAKLAYEKVQEWTLSHGYKQAILYIRADNLRSLEIHHKLGAQYSYTKHAEVWADGSIEDAHAFMVELQKLKNYIQHLTLQHLEETLSSLKREAQNTNETISKVA